MAGELREKEGGKRPSAWTTIRELSHPKNAPVSELHRSIPLRTTVPLTQLGDGAELEPIFGGHEA